MVFIEKTLEDLRGRLRMLRYGVYWKNEKRTDPLAAAALKQMKVMIHEFMIWLLHVVAGISFQKNGILK